MWLKKWWYSKYSSPMDPIFGYNFHSALQNTEQLLENKQLLQGVVEERRLLQTYGFPFVEGPWFKKDLMVPTTLCPYPQGSTHLLRMVSWNLNTICVSEVIRHRNHPLTRWLDPYRVLVIHGVINSVNGLITEFTCVTDALSVALKRARGWLGYLGD